jgi:hypothetical protein
VAVPGTLTPGRTAIAVVIVGLVAMWVYVVYLAVGPGRADPLDRLDDPAFAAAAEVRCASALAALEALPSAAEVASATERAEVLDRANAELAAMLDDLEGAVPTGEDGEMVQRWLADWRTYLDDRADYADRLRIDPEARLLVTAKGGRHITRPIDGFAADNRMPSCATPPDV